MEIDLILAALGFGFVTGFHCVGMCGPIAVSLPLKSNTVNARIASAITYNLGRTVTYASMGLVFGIVGQGFKLAGLQQSLSIVIGAIMIVSVFFPLLFKSLESLSPLYPLVTKLKTSLGLLFDRKSYSALFSIGLLNGLLPCGPVYAAIGLSLAAGNAVNGMLYMALFGLGTIPIMFSLNLLGNVVTLEMRRYMRKVVPVFIVLMGLWFVLKGMGLGIHLLSPPDQKLEINTELPAEPKCC